MKYICAPWRSEYFKNKSDKCPFCDVINKKDDEFGIIFRAKYCYGIMNLYPYSPGEFMIIPYKHISELEKLDNNTWLEINHFVKKGVKILKDSLRAQGINIGMNLGIAAGAGIADHIHYHIVPRYIGDTNFITTISGTRVNGVPFYEQFSKLKDAFKDEIC